MAILYITGDIEQKTVTDFLCEFNKIPKNVPITIYLNTGGGEMGHAQAIMDIINTEYKRITLVACGEIYSAGFNIFFGVKCKRRIVDETLGMAHFAWAPFELNEAGVPKEDGDKFLMNVMKANKNKTIQQFREIGLNKHEIGKLRSNKEAYFTTERLNELLKNGKSS